MEQEYKNNLPSRKFLIRGGIATAIILLLLVVQTAWFRALFNKKPLPTTLKNTETIGALVGKDSNGNGIADWEEKLWGLDPTVLYTNGVANKQIIEEKKKALGITENDGTVENETDLLAKQLFTITTAVGQSDQVTQDSLSVLGAQLGNDIDLKQITNHYTYTDVVTVKTSTASLTTYYTALSTIMTAYNDENTGISLVVAALETGDTSKLPELQTTGNTYMALARQLKKTPVPVALTEQHLALMNGFYGIGQSFSYLTQLDENGVYGIVGIGIYKEYEAKVDQAFSDLRDYFIGYGILKQ